MAIAVPENQKHRVSEEGLVSFKEAVKMAKNGVYIPNRTRLEVHSSWRYKVRPLSYGGDNGQRFALSSNWNLLNLEDSERVYIHYCHVQGGQRNHVPISSLKFKFVELPEEKWTSPDHVKAPAKTPLKVEAPINDFVMYDGVKYELTQDTLRAVNQLIQAKEHMQKVLEGVKKFAMT